MTSVSCPALFLSAPSSGVGKTTVTAALARFFVQQGKRVRVFKTGPDYLDPQILAQASGASVEPLDIWMAGEAYCKQRIFDAAKDADLILVEGAMGLYDGDPSSADLAELFGIPVAVVMNVKGMAQTAGALLNGLVQARPSLKFAGLIANQCGTQRHAELIQDSLPEDLALLATLPRSEEVTLPERHLGLVQADEVRDELEAAFNQGAQWLGDNALTQLPPAVNFDNPNWQNDVPSGALSGKTIAIAKDEAFSFIYAANEDCLRAMGAAICYFSPLHDETVPEADAYWLPGGYPELHAAKLAANRPMQQQLNAKHAAGVPVLAECGGFLYCLNSLTDLDDQTHPMAALMEGEGAMRGKRGCQGMQTAPLPEGDVRGHAHHRSRSANTPEPIAHGRRQ